MAPGFKGDVTREDWQRRLKQCCNNVATLYCAKNRLCESSRVTSPKYDVNWLNTCKSYQDFVYLFVCIFYTGVMN